VDYRDRVTTAVCPGSFDPITLGHLAAAGVVADLAAELPMALMNRHLVGVETVFLPGDPALAHVASSLVKDVARFGGSIDDLVPDGVASAVLAALDGTVVRGRTPASKEHHE